ncbi:MAG: hypothetical protein ACRDTE_31430 [Pseudonocardiaceae bacterium]
MTRGGPTPEADTRVSRNFRAPAAALRKSGALLTHPEQLAALRAEPDRLPAAIEELLRLH